MSEDAPQKLPVGRGGRGAMVLQALQAGARQPGQTAAAQQPGPAVPSFTKVCSFLW